MQRVGDDKADHLAINVGGELIVDRLEGRPESDQQGSFWSPPLQERIRFLIWTAALNRRVIAQ